ncbi:hypothetical protein OGAPHI_001898 [Ogataea philodendri]|uniref:UvrD-like helicase ATP-binding domain-containing protein n=1 Tax=Ogataea philodendri TaxID=1378263 RepID=A0A9P8PBC8_9ASCO|nr:uncharacterized protein OGAPHI_001898 [Ogataea philodendri]KAH3668144.1 hypothetical protein OGAPHI_001898 [Ogataea philodendri]
MSNLVELIENSHTKPTDDEVQQNVFNECYKYFVSLEQEHLFCDKTSAQIACYLLVICIAFDDSEILDNIKSKTRNSLDRCPKCIVGFHEARANARNDLLLKRNLPYDKISIVIQRVFQWEAQSLVDRLSKLQFTRDEDLLQDTDVLNTITECLICPQLLRTNENLKTLCSHLLEEVTKHRSIKPNLDVFAGILYFMFEGSEYQRDWALSCISENLKPSSFTSSFMEEYEIHFFNIQDPTFFNAENCINFWTNIIPFLRQCNQQSIMVLNYPNTASAFEKTASFKVVPLIQIFINQIMSYLNAPLPFLLRAFSVFLGKLENSFWELVQPHTYLNFFDVSFNSPHYTRFLDTLDLKNDKPSSTTPALEDLINWIYPLYRSVTPSQKTQTACIVFKYFIDKISRPKYGSLLACMGADIITDEIKLQNPLFDVKLTVELYSKSDARALIDKKSITLFDAMSNPAIKAKAVSAIVSSMMYDVASLAQASHFLAKYDSSTMSTLNMDLWILVSRKLSAHDTDFARNLLYSLDEASYVFSIDITLLKINFKSSKNPSDERLRELVAACSKQNKNVTMFSTSVEAILSRMSDFFTGAHLKEVLQDLPASIGLWKCICSCEEKMYDAAVGLLYETFDVDGRLEAIKELFNLDLAVTLEAAKEAFRSLTKLQQFNASKRGVRVLMDIVQCLMNPIDGVLIDPSQLNNSTRNILAQFWERCWKFLTMIYVKTFDWSKEYEKVKAHVQNTQHNEQITRTLMDFTRDVLELSQTMVDGYKMMVGCIQFTGMTEEQIKNVQQSLMQPVLNAFERTVYWLRLSDSALLYLCVQLTLTSLDLVDELQLEFGQTSLAILAKLCTKAKKFNNNLSEEQRGAILVRVRKFNSDLVDQIVAETESIRKGLEPAKPVSKSVTPVEEESTTRPKVPAKQSTLASFLSSKPYVPEPPPAPKRLSMLEQARLQLSEKRRQEPAPARPSGFNRKTRLAESDTSGSESESDSENSLFTREQVVAKLKKTKAALQSLQPRGKPMTVRGAGVARNVDLKKKAEELMRLRLNVNMNPLYNELLTWSYFRDSEYPDDDQQKYTAIKNTFQNAEDYQRTFRPLLLLECWQSIQRAKQVSQETPFKITIGSRSVTDNFFDVFASAKREVITEQKCVGDSDLVVLMFIENLEGESKITRKMLASCKHACFGRVKNIKNNHNGFSDITIRISTKSSLRAFLNPATEIVCMRVVQMTTLEREYSSLQGLKYYDLSKEIIGAVPSAVEKVDPVLVGKMKQMYAVNDSQAKAIAGSVHKDGFSLIQGPPGTGKTKTILGIIGYALTSGNTNVISVPGEQKVSPKRRILICAPSNAAVDELVLRLMGGIKNAKGENYKPNIVRLGRSDAVNAQVKSTTLEELVDAQLSAGNTMSDDSKIREEHRKCVKERDDLRNKLVSEELSADEVAKLEMKLQEVVQKRKELGRRLDELREQNSVKHRNREIERRNAQYKILSSAEVVCSTLSGSAHDVLAGMSFTFDTVVIDEAAQCIELSAIIPLRYGAKKCIMVGDPNQLPPTVLSQRAAEFNYEQSLFVRMQNSHSNSVYLLNMQYRMHPEISKFPSKEFYDSKLLDGPGMAEMNAKPWHSITEYGPYRFFDIQGSQHQNEQTKSLFNYQEAKIALEIVSDLFRLYPDENWSGKIGIISPYKEQIRCLREVFIQKYGYPITKEIDFNTVDGFQGQEKVIVLFSCVRAGEQNSGVGFLADVRRMNVALTRARSSLWVLGSKQTLTLNKTWRHLVEDLYERGLVTKASPGFTKNNSRAPVESAKKRDQQAAELAHGPKKQKLDTMSYSSLNNTKKRPSKSKPAKPQLSAPAPPEAGLPNIPNRPAAKPQIPSGPTGPDGNGLIKISKPKPKFPRRPNRN